MSRQRKNRDRTHSRRCQPPKNDPIEPMAMRGISEALECSMALDRDFDCHHAGFMLDHLGFLIGGILLTKAHETIDDALEVIEREIVGHPHPVSFLVLFSSGLEIVDDIDPQAELRFLEFRDRLASLVEVVDWLMSGQDYFRSVASMIDDPSMGWDPLGRLPHRAPRNAA
ncbi:MAG: hypothetical protein GY745_07655 [Actinomycetia bacterium]|nr:hypothetical protein [Actinomycetes bacterium]MCP4084912.1 hypothetical protein [Actinomycetes bacterium]